MNEDLQNFIKKTLKGTGATEKETNALFGLYVWNYYKSVLEVLLPLKSKDPQFFIDLNQVFDKAVDGLSEVDKKIFIQTIEEQKEEILKMIIGGVVQKLPKEAVNIVKANLTSHSSLKIYS